jgi:pyrroline-5-carboxylate reductase
MEKKARITVIGTGNMGGAFSEALSKNPSIDLSVFDSYRPCAEKVAQDKPIRVLDTMAQAKGSDAVIIAVKPQVLPEIYENLAALDPGLFISIAAGVTIEKLQQNLKTKKVVRFMPNIAAKVGKAVTAVAFADGTSDEHRQLAMTVAQSVGSAFELEEKLFSAFIGISGSGIAYMFDLMHNIAMGGVKEGIPYGKALSIVADTMISAAELQKQTGMNAMELEAMVCSAKGTTIEGVAKLAEGGFANALISAVEAAAARSRELEKKA